MSRVQEDRADAPAMAIVTYNSAADLCLYLPGQVAAARAVGWPLVAVDNGSSDGSPDRLRELAGAEGIVICNRRNHGYAAAVNQAFGAVPGRDVLLINPDVEIDGAAALRALAEFLRRKPKAGVVGPRLHNPNGTTQASARPFPSPLAMAGHASAIRRLPAARRAANRYLAPPGGHLPCRVGWLLGAAMLIRRQAYDDVGGWDERFFLYLEDTDFCRRLDRSGWERWYLPEVSLMHRHARGSDPARGSALSSRARRAHLASMIRFFRLHPELVAGSYRRQAP